MTLPWRKGLLSLAATLALTGGALDAQALTLGAVTVRSSLGQPLRAEIEVPQISSEEAATFSASMASPEIFDQLGVEFNPALTGASVTLERRRNGQAYLRVVGKRPVNEPFLGLVVDAKWTGGHVMRDYTMLVDPPRRAAPAPAPAAPVARNAPTRTTAPRIAPPSKVAVAEQVRPARSGARRTRTRIRGAAAPEPAFTGEGGQVTVRRGDTASSIARRHAAPGVSLDQMLVAMLRANPRAFIKGNVNLIRAGAVLNMPSAEQAAATPRRQARRTVVAQTRNFNAYRRGLASLVSGTKARVPAASRQASGNIQPQVRDTKAPAPSKDVVVMSRASAPGAAAKTETKISQSRQARESATRADELNRNIEELNRLGASAPAPAASGATRPAVEIPANLPGASKPAPKPAASSSAPAFKPVPFPPPSAPVLVEFPSAPAPAASAPAPLASAAAAPAASAATPAASAPASVASVQLPVPVIELPSQPASAAAPAAPARPASAQRQQQRRPAAPPPEPEPKPSLLGGMMGNPLLPLGLGGLLALLAGYGGWRLYKKKKSTALNSDFVGSESGSQAPNSWLGSGDGQKLDSKDGNVSAVGGLSMIYSPSQLDAAGDVDPVAEADVYLAYGRDAQAEEILKEALLTQPNRTSIHKKLAEIYSKRRDARALESIAQKVHAISDGQGADWQAIAMLGSELDPDNPLYKADTSNLLASAPDSQPMRPSFGADTVPLSAQSEQPEDSGAMDLDLSADLGSEAPVAALDPIAPEKPAPAANLDAPLDFPLDGGATPVAPAAEPAPAPAPAAAAPASAAADSNSGMLEFDMGELDIDPDSRSPDAADTAQPDDDNPLATQLELAKEFHVLGDIEGARKMVQEVIQNAEGKDPQILIRAQRFLAELDQ